MHQEPGPWQPGRCSILYTVYMYLVPHCGAAPSSFYYQTLSVPQPRMKILIIVLGDHRWDYNSTNYLSDYLVQISLTLPCEITI